MGFIELEGVDNVRDLGEIPVGDGLVVAPGLFYRGGALAGSTPSDREVLFGRLGVARVVDLRTGWERKAKPDPDIPGVENLHIPFYDMEKVGIEYVEPAAGTKAVGRDVACDPELFYQSLANPLTVGQMRAAADAAFESAAAGGPVYFHCSEGKDRAGVLALLVLAALGASREAVLEDYLLTNIPRDRNRAKALERFLRFADGDERLANELVDAHRARPENLDAFYEAIGRRYRSMDAFMRDQMGIDGARREALRRQCAVADGRAAAELAG